MSWRAFGKRVRRLTRFVIFGLVSSFLALGLILSEDQGKSFRSAVTLALMVADLLMLWQSMRGLRVINRLIPRMDDLEANWGGLLIPDPEQDLPPEEEPADEDPENELSRTREENPYILTHHLML